MASSFRMFQTVSMFQPKFWSV